MGKKSGRIEMRVTDEEDAIIRRAADIARLPTTTFILVAATERAEEIIRHAQTYALSAEAFDRFFEHLDEPARVVPELSDLFESR